MNLLEICTSKNISTRRLALCFLRKESVDVSPFGNYPLITMSKNRYVRIPHLYSLLDRGVDPNFMDYTGATALHYLCLNGVDPPIVNMLMSFGADMNKGRFTPFHVLLNSGNLQPEHITYISRWTSFTKQNEYGISMWKTLLSSRSKNLKIISYVVDLMSRKGNS